MDASACTGAGMLTGRLRRRTLVPLATQHVAVAVPDQPLERHKPSVPAVATHCTEEYGLAFTGHLVNTVTGLLRDGGRRSHLIHDIEGNRR